MVMANARPGAMGFLLFCFICSTHTMLPALSLAGTCKRCVGNLLTVLLAVRNLEKTKRCNAGVPKLLSDSNKSARWATGLGLCDCRCQALAQLSFRHFLRR